MFLLTIIDNLNKSALKMFFAVMILLGGFILGKLLEKFLYKILKEVELNKTLKDAGIKINADKILSTIASYLVYLMSFLASLEQLGLANTVITVLSMLIILVFLISFYLGVRDFIPNFSAGFYLFSRDSIKEGDNVEIDNIKGELIGFDLLQVRIKTKSGDIIHIPNSTAVKSKITVSNKKHSK
jgi:small-conductance mechanosensitive channel